MELVLLPAKDEGRAAIIQGRKHDSCSEEPDHYHCRENRKGVCVSLCPKIVEVIK
jgi:hypothetical protein